MRKKVPKATKMVEARKASSTSNCISAIVGDGLDAKSRAVVPGNDLSALSTDETVHVPVLTVASIPAQCCIAVSPSRSDELSVSADETMSTCESFKSPDVEYIDNDEVSALDSIDRKNFGNLYISEHSEKTGKCYFGSSIVSS